MVVVDGTATIPVQVEVLTQMVIDGADPVVVVAVVVTPTAVEEATEVGHRVETKIDSSDFSFVGQGGFGGGSGGGDSYRSSDDRGA